MGVSGTDPHLLMLSSFRDRHPLGSVVTELLRVEEGLYVVKAQIVVGGVPLGSGMAASTTVEEAEDAAIHRALRIAGVDDSLHLASLGGGPASVSSPVLTSQAVSGIGFSGSSRLDSSSNGSNGDSSFSSVDEWATPPPVPEPSKPIRKSTPPATPEPAPDIEDLSELIAKTDVELTRIGWGPKEGRRFLKERFQKQSRQQLDESELREFLQELKKQPTKMLEAAEF
ncbi:MAG: hypothetical protein AB4040_10170 [Synechococcus sp.]